MGTERKESGEEISAVHSALFSLSSMDVWVYEIYSTKNVYPVPSDSGINFSKMLDFIILIVDDLGKLMTIYFTAFFADRKV